MSASDELKRLHELHQAGALTDEEFAKAKARVLEGAGASPSSSTSSSGSTGFDQLTGEVKKLRRSNADRWLGGVCGGLGRASGIESWVWRLIFIMCVLFAGFGFLIYILMWLLIPEE
jgi:phage shock protein PspC (stress-responsive transcriptional regulator)